MAKYAGLITINGSIGGFTYYVLNGKQVVRAKRVLDKEEFLHRASYQKMRANSNEFGHCSHVGKMLRGVLQPLLAPLEDKSYHHRLTSVLVKVKNCDLVSGSGQRTIAEGLKTEAGRALLTGFRFTKGVALDRFLRCPMKVNFESGVVVFETFSALHAIKVPKTSAQIILQSAVVVMDFEADHFSVKFSEPVLLFKDCGLSSVTLATEIEDLKGVKIMVLFFGFGETVNGVFYPLRKGEWGVEVLNVE